MRRRVGTPGRVVTSPPQHIALTGKRKPELELVPYGASSSRQMMVENWVTQWDENNTALDAALCALIKAKDAVSLQDQVLADQHNAQVNFLHGARYQADAMAKEVRGLQSALSNERMARQLEREGYQKIQGLSSQQARHLSDLNRAADRRIEELEGVISALIRQATEEYNRVLQYARETEKQLVQVKESV